MTWFGTPSPDVYPSYEQHLLNSPSLLVRLPELVGKELVCWCTKDTDRCNCEALVKWSNLLEAGAFSLDTLPRPPGLVQSTLDGGQIRAFKQRKRNREEMEKMGMLETTIHDDGF
jgi:hypothetical protein